MHAEPFSSPKVFPLGRKWKLLFVRIFVILSILIGVFFAVPIAVLWPGGTIHLGIFFIFLCAGAFLLCLVIEGLFIWYIIKTVRHIAFSEGIQFSSLGYSIYTPWSNIRGIEMRRFGAAFSLALLLQQPAIKGTIQDGRRRAVAVMQNPFILEKREVLDAIPLLFDLSENWQESDLISYIRYYAPQAFSNQSFS